MGEIVWAKTIERREHLELHSYGQLPADYRTTIFASRDKVAMVEGTMMVGANRNSDKKYYFWRSVSSIGFFRNRAGNLQPYRAIRPLKAKSWSSYYPETSFYYLEEDEGMAAEPMREFRKACKEHLGLTGAYDLYPMAEVMDMPNRFNLLPANLRPHMRTTDWNEYLVGAFGKTRVTPEFIKVAKSAEPYVVSLAHEFRGLIPDTLLIKFMKKNQFNEEMMEKFRPHTPKVRKALIALDERSRRRVIGQPVNLVNSEIIKSVSDRYSGSILPHKKRVNALKPVDGWMGLYNQL